LPVGYDDLLTDLKRRIGTAQVKAALSVNRELLELYWGIGRAIVERQQGQRWGSKVIDRLARDIQAAFPGLVGFSRGNIFRMRSFFLAYGGEAPDVAQPARQREKTIVAQVARQLPHPIAGIPWGHNIVLLERLKDPAHRLWYARQTLANGWSRAVLDHQIDLKLHERAGKALTNFSATLPQPDSDLAHQLLKDPYNFDFLNLGPAAHERDLESGLIDHIKEFLLELGRGFAFVGRQYAIEIGGEAFYLDLLFYHLKLRRYVVIDLKIDDFRPEFAGKMNFYLSAADDLLRSGDDQPSIGLILCKTRNNVIAEYALRDTTKPMGVATYGVRLPESLRGALPSPREISDALQIDDKDSRDTV
jgi:predicted nuclease of restriction endonuclease-like (RecB) superfamily